MKEKNIERDLVIFNILQTIMIIFLLGVIKWNLL